MQCQKLKVWNIVLGADLRRVLDNYKAEKGFTTTVVFLFELHKEIQGNQITVMVKKAIQ